MGFYDELAAQVAVIVNKKKIEDEGGFSGGSLDEVVISPPPKPEKEKEKKGISTLTIVLIVAAAVAVLYLLLKK